MTTVSQLSKLAASQATEYGLKYIPQHKLLGQRIFLFSAAGYSQLHTDLFKNLGTPGGVILYQMGKSYGSQLGSNLRKYDIDTLELLSRIREITAISGWGQIEMELTDSSIVPIKLAVSDSVFCKSTIDGRNKNGHFLCGTVAGIVEQVLGGSYQAKETKCLSVGDSSCEIVVEEL